MKIKKVTITDIEIDAATIDLSDMAVHKDHNGKYILTTILANVEIENPPLRAIQARKEIFRIIIDNKLKFIGILKPKTYQDAFELTPPENYINQEASYNYMKKCRIINNHYDLCSHIKKAIKQHLII